jgi:hypothetical protein
VVRALVGDDVLGDTEAPLRGELLERRLPVQPRAERGGGVDERVEEAVDERRGGLDAAGEVDGADDGLDGVGDDRGLLATAGGLLATTELDVVAEPDRPADLGERAGVDDGGAQLRQPTLGEVGVLQVQRLGDDDAEDRVTEELEALVRRQATVLVGVRAMGESPLEELGVQDRIPERLAQLGIVRGGGQRTRPLRISAAGTGQRTWRRSARAPY